MTIVRTRIGTHDPPAQVSVSLRCSKPGTDLDRRGMGDCGRSKLRKSKYNKVEKIGLCKTATLGKGVAWSETVKISP